MAQSEEQVETFLHHRINRVVVFNREQLKPVPTHPRQVDAEFHATVHDTLAQFQQGLFTVVIGHAGITFLQPFVGRFFRAMNGWQTRPEGIVQVECDDVK